MSSFTSATVVGPGCDASFDATMAESVNIARMPEARRLLLDGEFHVQSCPSCGQRVTLDTTFLYSDFPRRQFVHVFATGRQPAWQHWEQVAGQTFAEGFAGAPEFLEDASREFAVRAVFGMAGLAEKIRIWQADLDDSIVELVKVELIATTPELAAVEDPELLLVHAGIDELELLARPRGALPDEDVTLYRVDRDRYRHLDSERAALMERWPGLFLMPYVSYCRLGREPALPATLTTPNED